MARQKFLILPSTGNCGASKLLRRWRIVFALGLLGALGACAQSGERPASTAARQTDWAFERSDLPVDPAFRFGRLANGMRYIVRHNATPKGTALVRLDVAAGSLDESEAERGFAHFVEHMAFNGSTNVAEGEMVRLLERNGLAFGADTNAETSFDHTTYKLDLPRSDPALLDLAIKLMRETASELTISAEAVDRERGVLLAEMRDRNTWQLRNAQDQASFQHPRALYARRFPIGTAETVQAATADALRAFWRREYVPSQTTVIVIGDFPVEQMEEAVKARFGDWQGANAAPQPMAGPIVTSDRQRTAIYLDPALSERITASRHGKWRDEPDNAAQRQQNTLRQIGHAIVNRRMLRLSREANAPFRSGGFGTAETFKASKTTNLVVDTVDGKWRNGLQAAALEYRRAMRFGFLDSEVAEQVANLRTAAEEAAASAETRSHATLAGQLFALLRDDMVPATPQSSLARLKAYLPAINPTKVLIALKQQAVPLKQPLLRFQGRKHPEGGERALRSAWNEAMAKPLERPRASATQQFGYQSFGPAGQIAADTREAKFGVRQIRFANGVLLNLKQTTLEADRVIAQVSIDGGEMLRTRERPLATDMMPYLTNGGLGRHSQDQLQTVLAGRNLGLASASSGESFVFSGQTTPQDLGLQLRLLAAQATDPGYRLEGEVLYRQNVNNYFARRDATPQSVLSHALGGILSGNDPRFSFQPVEAYRKLTFTQLREAIAERLAHGAVEIAVVGDFVEQAAINEVSASWGALPAREARFQPYHAQRQRPFTADRSSHVLRHKGPADQALLRLTWPTRDDSDLRETLTLDLLERVVQLALTETLREQLGQAYSPSAASMPSAIWRGYGTFAVSATVTPTNIPAARTAIDRALASIRDTLPSDDVLMRARAPLLERYDNALKGNAGWLSLIARAQSKPERLERFSAAKAVLGALTGEDVRSAGRRYLTGGGAVEIVVVPEAAASPP